MSISLSDQQRRLLSEVEGLPEEYFPLLLQPVADSFRRGWEEAQGGHTLPVDRL